MVLWVCKVQHLLWNCAQPGARSHLPLPIMNRHSQTKSVVFKAWMLYFQRISFQVVCIGNVNNIRMANIP